MARAAWSTLVVAVGLAVLFPLPAGAVEAQTEASLALSLRTECTEIMSSETATVRALLAVDGMGISGARLDVRSSGGGNLTSPADLGDGRYEFSWTAPLVFRQVYVALYVRARTDAYGDASSRIVFLVDPNPSLSPTMDPEQLFVLGNPSSWTLRPGGTVEIGLFVFTMLGYIVSDVTIETAVRGFGTLGAPSRRGCGYVLTFTASSSIIEDTTVLITVSVMKFTYAIGTTRIGLTITV